MKRLFLLWGLLLAIATPNFSQTKTDTIYFEFDIDKDATSAELVYRFSDKVRDSIEVEYHDGQNQGKFKAEDGEQRMTVYGKGYWRIFFSYELPFEYSIHISPEVYHDIDDIDIYGVSLTTLDVSNCNALEKLSCSYNQLTSLDISHNTSLTELDCYGNQLTSLNVGQNTALTMLGCGDNALTTLDVSGCTALTTLYCYGNQLTNLDVSHNTDLKELYCGIFVGGGLEDNENEGNQLTSLDVSHNTALEYLECANNKLTSLDISRNTALEYLDCYNNKLTSLDISRNTALHHLECSNNQLTTLDVSRNTILIGLYCNYNRLTELNVGRITTLEDLKCAYNQLKSLDIGHNTTLEYLACDNNRIPLSMLHKAYTLVDYLFDFKANPQTDTIVIYNQQFFDLSSERVLGETVSFFEITDGSGQTLSSDAWTEQDFIFHFHENGLYKLTLQNPGIIEHYYVYDDVNDDILIEDPVTFTWYISVKDENNDVATEAHETDRLRVYAQDRTIYLSENRGLVQVFNTLGQCVYSGTATAIPVPQSGLYIVRVGTRSHKVLVR